MGKVIQINNKRKDTYHSKQKELTKRERNLLHGF